MRSVLFHRDFRGYSGGHGKVADYVGHVDAHPGFEASTWLVPGATVADNPWLAEGMRLAATWAPAEARVLFLAGMDWHAVPTDKRARPVINLVQGLAHGDPGDARHAWLSRPAIRICVSSAVANAIEATGRVNGPVHVIPAGLAPLPATPARPPLRPGQAPRVVITGGKEAALAEGVATAMAARGGSATVLPAGLSRTDFLAALAVADIAVLLPHEREGFYLPGLEAMALGCAVVLPDAQGNREYLQPDENARVPAREPTAIADAALGLRDAVARAALVEAGLRTVTAHSLMRERQAFHALLDRLDEEWAACRHG